MALFASGSAAADGVFSSGRTRGDGSTAASLYVAVPFGPRNGQRAKPVLGLRLQELPLAPDFRGAALDWRAKTILDVPLVTRREDPLRDSGAAMLIGKGLIVGIVVGAVVALSVISDDDDGDGGY